MVIYAIILSLRTVPSVFAGSGFVKFSYPLLYSKLVLFSKLLLLCYYCPLCNLRVVLFRSDFIQGMETYFSRTFLAFWINGSVEGLIRLKNALIKRVVTNP